MSITVDILYNRWQQFLLLSADPTDAPVLCRAALQLTASKVHSLQTRPLVSTVTEERHYASHLQTLTQPLQHAAILCSHNTELQELPAPHLAVDKNTEGQLPTVPITHASNVCLAAGTVIATSNKQLI